MKLWYSYGDFSTRVDQSLKDAEGFHIPKGTKLVETNGVRSRSYETNSHVTHYTWDKEFVLCRVSADLIEIRHVDPNYNDRITTVALKDVLLYY